MKGLAPIAFILVLAGCNSNDLTWLSIRNDTGTPIYIQPYSSEFTNGEWIQPGFADDFYSINCDCVDGFKYFSFYYDSLIVYLKEHDTDPVKFYKDGSTVNYDPALNPFINPDVWKSRDFDRHVDGSAFNTMEEKHIYEHFFCIDADYVISLTHDVLE